MRNLLSYLFAAIVILTLASPIVLIQHLEYKSNFSGFQHEEFILPFEIMNPDSIYNMPKKLKEISGLSHYKDQQFFAVNDEKGILYLYDLATEQIISKMDFGKSGDYEAITKYKNLIYIAESNGNIKVIDNSRQIKVGEFKTSLSKRNDIEGMAYDTVNDVLLLACKGDIEKKGKNKNSKGIYSFDPSTKEKDVEKYRILKLKEEVDSLKRFNLFDNFINNTNTTSRIKHFAPSGITFDPITGYLYILANRGKILVVLDQEKVALGVYFLSHKIFGQPEGISFDEAGNLYISNEAKSTKANIIQFNRKETERKTLKDVLDIDLTLGTEKSDSTEIKDSLNLKKN
ncbi:SdiA-regulated domain-containing protein [Saprospiraceae bacterium]|nr:SdiA-regulated domain-containing protein [Saprospiraceae bacterium]